MIPIDTAPDTTAPDTTAPDTTAPDIRPWDRRALRITEEIVDRVEATDLDRPTPCSEWTLHKLLAHMIGQNHGFAAAAEGVRTERADWADREFGDDWAGAFRDSSARVARAFAREGVLDTEFWLPEVRGGQMFPARTAIGFHFVDYVVHGWDVAAAIGVPAAYEAELLDAVLPYVEEVPDGSNRLQPGSSFRPGLATGSTDRLDRILAMLGRSPRWPVEAGEPADAGAPLSGSAEPGEPGAGA
ncbi:TIGR03086 family metal-binding protein [Kitasatospora sp. NPDC001309]|uniref:TIGR03086 family metal-binding protein n=1 Tax=unclassified Kitasatospora TaxID=2633591 RepID=UPI003688D8FB